MPPAIAINGFRLDELRLPLTPYGNGTVAFLSYPLSQIHCARVDDGLCLTVPVNLAVEGKRPSLHPGGLRPGFSVVFFAPNLHLEPDCEDGMVLNIVPLHELVPWKEARSDWQELLDVPFKQSSSRKQLWDKGLVP